MIKISHSVFLESDKCKGCTTCIKHCPTQAIRVRNGKAHIIEENCIDCGQCIRVCPHRAKKAVCDSLDLLENYEYKIALPAPSLYGQFGEINDINVILTALRRLGFDDVFEVSRAAEVISDYTRARLKKGDLKLPIISSACPVALRLIKLRFPDLLENLMPVIAPVELAAIEAKRIAAEKTGLPAEKIGAFFISPCPAKVTSAKHPIGLAQPVIDGVFSMSEIFVLIHNSFKSIEEPESLSSSGIMGIGWAGSGGESSAVLSERHIAVDGIENILSVLDDIEDERIEDIDFIELNACTQGCVGGCLAFENPFVARMRIKRLMKYLPVSKNRFIPEDAAPLLWTEPPEYVPVAQYGENMAESMRLMAKMQAIAKDLPGLDCGSCGAPTCEALAEDIVLGFGSEEDCIFKMRERMQYMAGGDGDDYLPRPFRNLEGDIGNDR